MKTMKYEQAKENIAVSGEHKDADVLSTMKTAIFIAPKQIEIREYPIPQPGPEEVLIKLEGCGICASSIPVWEGREWFKYPLEPGAPGHEGWGIVEAVGRNVSNIQIGERVAALSYHAFAEYDVAKYTEVVPLPDVLEGKPFPGEPLGCAINIFGRAGIKPGDKVAIVGIGFLGSLLTKLAVQCGATVIALSQRSFSLDVAKRCEAKGVVQLKEKWTAIKEAREKINEEGFNVVIEAVGLQETLDIASELTKERGRLIIAGYHQDGLRTVNMQLWNWKGIDVINAHERDPQVYIEGISEAVKSTVNGKLSPFDLITHSYRLEELNEAFQAVKDRPDGLIKAYIKF